jgi:hypothetical protein
MIFRLIGKADRYKTDFGGQKALIDILNGMHNAGYQTEWVSYFGNFITNELFRASIPNTKVLTTVQEMLQPCDIFMLFVGSQARSFGKEVCKVFNDIPEGAKKVISLNTVLGQVADYTTEEGRAAAWAREFDLYIFENTAYMKKFLSVVPNRKAIVLHPCVDISPFLKISPTFQEPIHVVRLVSRPKTKIPRNTNDLILKIREYQPNCIFSFMEYTDYIMDAPYIYKYHRDQIPPPEFLARGNCFWHPLPPGVGEPGPRVIVEAMAAGLPVIANGGDGPKDRVTPETGWHVNSLDEIPEIFKGLTVAELERKGKAARERAISEFGVTPWVNAIINE